MAAQPDYTKLRELLKQEKYPMTYIHKFIGMNTSAFRDAVEDLEDRFPGLREVSRRESSDSGSGDANYLACTFNFIASSADEIIELMEATRVLADIKIML
jgi:putative lipoic acid-binding regulatory protein